MEHVITIQNKLHGTEAFTRVDDDYKISADRVRAIWRRLCGMPDCKCSGPLGDYGEITDEDGDGMMFYDGPDGGGRFEHL